MYRTLLGVSKEYVLIEKKELKKGSKEFVLIENNDFYISIYNKESPSVWPHLAMRTNTVLTPCEQGAVHFFPTQFAIKNPPE